MTIKNQNFDRLVLEHQHSISERETEIYQWKQRENDYIKLKETLNILPNELKHDIMVPIGKLAFMPGKIIKTNEILVLLGDNWFVEKSSKQAVEVIDRRTKAIKERLVMLQKEIKTLNEELNSTYNIINENKEYINIEEKLDENEDKIHKKKELSEQEKKEQRILLQKKALKIQSLINESIKNSRLDKIIDQDDDDDEIKEEIEAPNVKNKAVRWSDDNYKQESDDLDESEDDSDSIVEDKTNVIYIKHTNLENFNESNIESASSDTQYVVIKTPADIYKIFHKPKSILKTASAYENEAFEDVVSIEKKSIDEDSSLSQIDFQPHKAFTGEIVEHQTETNVNSLKSNSENLSEPIKKVSKFKASKK